jgi:hypothetical protein
MPDVNGLHGDLSRLLRQAARMERVRPALRDDFYLVTPAVRRDQLERAIADTRTRDR